MLLRKQGGAKQIFFDIIKPQKRIAINNYQKEITMNYYKVVAKCGHVRRGHYIIKDFFVTAEDGKEAAHKVRFLPRVKHDWKDAIVSVTAITRKEYIQGRELQNQDLYFKVTNSSEQKLYGAIDYEQVIDYVEHEKKKKDKDILFYNKMARIRRKDLKMRLAEAV